MRKTFSARRSLVLVKHSKNTLNNRKIRQSLEQIKMRALSGARIIQGWKLNRIPEPKVVPSPNDSANFTYRVSLCFTKTKPKPIPTNTVDLEFRTIVNIVRAAGNSSRWQIEGEEENTNKSEQLLVAIREDVKVAEIVLPNRTSNFFSGIFERDSQIRLLLSALEGAIATSFRRRNHCLLWGLPGCGKTETLERLVDCLQKLSEPGAVLKLDSTATTKAGLENHLLKLEVLPQVIVIEELEKANENNLAPLLALLDMRAEVRKLNARMNRVQKIHALTYATVNDLGKFVRTMSGALASRFQHHVYFPRPSRRILQKILHREVQLYDGNAKWVEPVLTLCDELVITDPRKAVSFLDGQNRLLTGEFQKDYKKMLKAQEDDKETIQKQQDSAAFNFFN